MTACCCRLTQPENSRSRKASGGGSGSMAEVCLRSASASNGGGSCARIATGIHEGEASSDDGVCDDFSAIGRRPSFRTPRA